jgi:hypothetical protein
MFESRRFYALLTLLLRKSYWVRSRLVVLYWARVEGWRSQKVLGKLLGLIPSRRALRGEG